MQDLIIRHLGMADYEPTWQAMQRFTEQRDANTADELWLLEHPPVFTQGQAGKAEHLLATGDIPVVQVDRGGQVTYHGPGQLVGYTMIDIKRHNMGVRELVSAIEKVIVAVLAQYDISASPRADAPGVYLETGAKIAQLGLRVRKGCTFHGLSLNIAMDMEPFLRINPCGHIGMSVTNMQLAGVESPDMTSIEQQLSDEFCQHLGYTKQQHIHCSIDDIDL